MGIEFSYWDGVTWQIEWSSDEYEELPLAISVTDPAVRKFTSNGRGWLRGDAVFTHIVRLPLANPIDQTEEDELSEAGL